MRLVVRRKQSGRLQNRTAARCPGKFKIELRTSILCKGTKRGEVDRQIGQEPQETCRRIQMARQGGEARLFAGEELPLPG
jgi:hypothetical protein